MQGAVAASVTPLDNKIQVKEELHLIWGESGTHMADGTKVKLIIMFVEYYQNLNIRKVWLHIEQKIGQI